MTADAWRPQSLRAAVPDRRVWTRRQSVGKVTGWNQNSRPCEAEGMGGWSSPIATARFGQSPGLAGCLRGIQKSTMTTISGINGPARLAAWLATTAYWLW